MDSDRTSKAQSILKNNIDELGSIFQKKEAEQKIINQKIRALEEELEKLKNKEKKLATVQSINKNKYIKTMR
ncbi:uncharacterized protein METZ01_LOCUS457122 [marine metagenome]|uniref:Uncharacterized protein n=1 Tax=marine metagenome TaxID=408172 RepID=A0A383AB05_9ZZZZ|tara:strand:+ start:740 stop:955 length:216 start_codon:yes stop_codon:yes gene_type:complete